MMRLKFMGSATEEASMTPQRGKSNQQTRAMDEQEYVLGTNRDELVRLGLQHQLWARYAADAWERAGFGPGKKLLDVGCGPGYASLDLAALVGTRGHVHAIDISE